MKKMEIVEEINNTPVVRLTGMFLEDILKSPKKSFSVTLDDVEYTLKVIKKERNKS